MDQLDLTDKKRKRKVKAEASNRYGESIPDAQEPTDKEAAKAAELEETRCRLMSFYRQELERQAENRHEQAIDEDYRDGIQLTAEDLQALKDRGQPPVVYNVIGTTLNWIFGSEKRGRTDAKILPRGKEDAKPAERKSKYMKYLSDVNRLPFHRSAAFVDAATVGVGWLECGYRDEDEGEPIYERGDSWRNVLWDSSGSRLTQDDWRYMFRTRWADEDAAVAMFKYLPGAEAKIRASAQDSSLLGSFDLEHGDLAMDQAESLSQAGASNAGGLTTHTRRRVRLIQAEYRNPEEVEKLRGGPFNGQIYDKNDPRHVDEVESGRAKLVKKMVMRMRMAVLTPTEIIYDAPAIYRHNTFSLTPIWCFIRGRDGMPYGFVRNLRSIQDGINKRASKALHILSSNKVIIEEGALGESMTFEEFQDEVARPDAIIPMASGKMDRIQINVDRGMDQAHMAMMQSDIGMVQQVGGVTDELMGRKTNAVSGVAVQARQEQGSLATSGPFDNLRLAVQMHGEKVLSLVEQFATEEKQFRITNLRGTPEFVTMNDGLPENDITRSKADYVVSEAEWRVTMRQAATAELMELMSKMPPEVGMNILDLLVDSMDIENREEIVKRLRAMNGGKDPDQSEPTPEDMQKEQAMAQQQAMQQRDIELGFMEREANIADKMASAEKKAADTDVARSVMFNNNMTGLNSAMSAATQVIQAPTIARVADPLIKQGGWVGGLPKNIPAAPPQQLPPPNVAPEQVPPQAAPAPFPPQQ